MVYKPYTNLANTWMCVVYEPYMWNKNMKNFVTYMWNGLNGDVLEVKKF